MPNTDRVARPSKLTPEDIRRMDARIAAYDRARAIRRRNKLIARGLFVVIVLGVWLRLLWAAGAPS